MGKMSNLKGNRFGRLIPIKTVGIKKSRHAIWECKCDCGNIVDVSSNSLKSGRTTSCGCYAAEVLKNNKNGMKHDLSRSRVYNIWAQMKQRCDNPNHKSYKLYGLRGIKYSDDWKTFDGFWQDMQGGYSDNLTLDRIDNNKGYCKENCRWATARQQANNKSTNTIVQVDGVIDTVSNMARICGISPELASWRIKRGIPVEDAFKNPIRKRKAL